MESIFRTIRNPDYFSGLELVGLSYLGKCVGEGVLMPKMHWSHEIGDTKSSSTQLTDFRFPDKFKLSEEGITSIQTTTTQSHVTELKIISGKGL